MRKGLIAFFLLFVLLSQTASWAGDEAYGPETVMMEETVVTATRTEEKVNRIPANVTVVDSKDIENSNAKNVTDLLRSEEGIVIRDLLGNGKTAQIDLRGFGETAAYNTAVLVDGRRVNEIDLSGVDWTQIPLDQIERIEIVRGTGSVLYGDNSVGGVINIITKTPTEKPTIRVGTVTGSFGRNKHNVSLSGGTEKISAAIFASYDSTNGYRENSELRNHDIGGKIIYDPTDFLSFNLSGSYHSDEYGMPGGLTRARMHDDRRESDYPYDDARTRDRYVKLGADLDMNRFGMVTADFSYRDRNTSFNAFVWNYAQTKDSETWAFTPRYVREDRIMDHRNSFITGIDLYWTDQDIDSFSGTSLSPSGRSEIDRDSYGLYVNDEFSILQNLILSVGVRHERVKYDLEQIDLTGLLSPLDTTVVGREKAYSAGLTFLYSGKSSVFIRANRSLRFPLTDELVVYDFFAGRINLNSNLKPQRGKHYEIGIRHYFTPDIRANVTLFRANISDEIFFNPDTFTNTNHPKTRHEGLEMGIKADLFKKLTIFTNYTYEKAKFRSDPFDGNYIPAVPKHKGNMGILVHNVIPGFLFSIDYRWVGSSYLISDQANQDEKLRRYHTLNSRISYDRDGIRAFLGVDNITDTEYSEYGVSSSWSGASYYPAPERTWTAGIEINWGASR